MRLQHREGSRGSCPASFHLRETVFYVTVGSEYEMLGLGIYRTTMLGLILDDTRTPSWLPIGLFKLQGSTLPTDWRFAVLDGRAASGGAIVDGWVALWGYQKLVEDASHRDGLVENDVDALKIFFRELARREGRS
jgi:hypothetical protein